MTQPTDNNAAAIGDCAVGDTAINASTIVELAWCDWTSFESICADTGLSEKEVIRLMRRTLKPRSFKLWRKRVTGRPQKHGKRRLIKTRERHTDD